MKSRLNNFDVFIFLFIFKTFIITQFMMKYFIIISWIQYLIETILLEIKKNTYEGIYLLIKRFTLLELFNGII